MLCTKIVFLCFCFDIQHNICTQHVLNMYVLGNSMNNLLSYCGLTDSRMRASEKDLPVYVSVILTQLGRGPSLRYGQSLDFRPQVCLKIF